MRTTFLKFSKKMVALFLGCLLIFSAFGVCGVLSVSAKDANPCVKILGTDTASSKYNGGRLNVAVTANETYTVEFSYYYKTASGTPGFRVLNGSSSGDAKLVDYTIPSADNDAGWKTYTVNVTPTASTISVWFHNGNMSADGELYVDDVSVVKSGETTNIFPNGDFSAALSSSWKIVSSLLVYSERPVIETEEGEKTDADYALQVVASQQYKELYQSFNVSADTDYVVKLDVKSVGTNNTQLRVYQGSAIGDTRLVSQMLSGADWTTVTYEFNTETNTQVTLSFVTTILDETAYTLIDNVSIYKKSDETAVVFSDDFSAGNLDAFVANSLIGTVFNVYTKEESSTEEELILNYALKVQASQQYKELYQVFNVSADTDYVVKLDIKSVGANNTQLRVYPGSGTGSPTRLVSQMLSSTAWTTVTYEFNSGSNTQVTLSFITTVLNASMYTGIDNISIYKKADETAVIYEEDFASGSLTNYIAASGLIGTVFNVYNKDEYDYNGDGKVDIRDLVRIVEYLSDSTVEISLVADDNGTIEEADIAATRTVLLERY